MKMINLRDYYPLYTSDIFLEVEDEIALSLKRFDLDEKAYQLRTYRHKAYYSLDRDDGIEHEAVFISLSPQEIYERRLSGVFALVFIILLGGCSRVADDPVKLMDKAPWGDYQKAVYEIYNGEDKVGTAEIEVVKSEPLGAYEIKKVKKTGTTEIKSGATIKTDTLMPIESFYNKTSDNDSFEISTAYATNWKVKTGVSGNAKEQSIGLPDYYYDNESLLVILAALPYEEIDTFKLNDAVPLTAKVSHLSGKYVGKERITVPYGEAECYKVTFGSLNFWYSSDDSRILYQYKDGDTIYKLTDLTSEKSE